MSSLASSAIKPRMTVLRGAPGSGKSTLAQQIVAASTNPRGVAVCSTDSYFMRGDVYRFDPTKLGEYHAENQAHAAAMCAEGLDVIVDNTNSALWEMKPYVEAAVHYGCSITVVTCRSNYGNIHGVPSEVVQRIDDNLRRNPTPVSVAYRARPSQTETPAADIEKVSDEFLDLATILAAKPPIAKKASKRL